MRVLVLGGGFAGMFAAREFHRRLGRRAEVELINDVNYFVFQPLLPEVAAGAVSILTLVSLAQPGAAEEVVNTGYFGDVAIKGYDPVAYFTQNAAVRGSEEFSYSWLGATWHFASAENRDCRSESVSCAARASAQYIAR